MTIKSTDKVRLMSINAKMSIALRSRIGEIGEVCSPCEPNAVKVRVRFENCTFPLWVDVCRLEVVHHGKPN